MKFLAVALTILLLIAVSYSQTVAEIPTSPRLRAVIQRVSPKLERELSKQGFRFGSSVFIRIFKEPGKLELFLEQDHRFKLFRTYPICYFSGHLGPKLRQGDRQSPEGFYYVKPGQLNPNSRFHLSFNLGYPNAYDRAHGRTGSALMVHGSCVSIGCYAMTDPIIEEIYTVIDAAFRAGQSFFRVHIFPFPLTEANLARHQESKWYDFWWNLKTGYELFESTGRPPNVTVRGTSYRFESESPESTQTALRLVKGARAQIGVTVGYDPAYRRIAYPGGDVPRHTGVCTDVVVRAYRALGVDLQELVHRDMRSNFALYPSKRIWNLSRPDQNIDHRRVPNLQVFFKRHGQSFGVTQGLQDLQPGDLLTWKLPGGADHIGIVSDRINREGQRPLILHNIGSGTQEEDIISQYTVTGHFRYLPTGS